MDLTQKIYTILTKRKYNRGKPFLANDILNLINTHISKNEPIKLVGFWGTGPKNKPNWADEESCKFLNNLNREIKEIYKAGIEFTFIFANSHGIYNGYKEDDINSYITGMIKIFNQYDFKYLFLDALWKKYGISFEKITSELETRPADWWSDIFQKEVIEKNALHRNKNYVPVTSAQKYYIMRELEKEMFEKEFKSYIFHAFSDPKLQAVLPSISTLYFYGRESWSNAPWFVTKEKFKN